MKLLYDQNDLPHAAKLRDSRFAWLKELGATELTDADLNDPGFLFGYDQGDEHYRRLLQNRPNVHDSPDERYELARLDHVLQRLRDSGIDIPTSRTWILNVDEPAPDDLAFPVFVRTAKSSWKRGGKQSRAENLRELNDEVDLLRRAFGWDAPILLREWLDLAAAGKWMFGDAPQEIRIWIVDRVPRAWSFHYLHVVHSPAGFPPKRNDLSLLADMAARIGSAFTSRLISADFIRDRRGKWYFLEAGPGAASGTAHEAVFKFVADKLRAGQTKLCENAAGGPL